MDFNISVIVGQLSDYNSMLKEKEDARKDEKHIFKPKIRAKENEHVRNEVDNNKLIKEKKEDTWITPKCVPIDYFCKKITTHRKRKRAETHVKC